MTQRVDLSTVMNHLAIDAVITAYANAVDDGAWADYRALFTADGRADYRGPGGVEGPVAEVAQWLEETLRYFPVRQHLILNRRITLQDLGGYPGDRADVRADYVNPMLLDSIGGDGDGGRAGAVVPNFLSGGRYTFTLSRAEVGSWRIRTMTVHEMWRGQARRPPRV
ncbi:nuclear transport factor 2 family protein [Streptomyces sp. NPDC052052]|uniref:nuclear transport factor 2 family protein n=1 Tax=Streptomyces sp. NPDC052052 TaxID=3154756 RepID=UPI003424C3F4